MALMPRAIANDLGNGVRFGARPPRPRAYHHWTRASGFTGCQSMAAICSTSASVFTGR